MSGLVFVWLVVGSPLATFDHQLLTIHMLKHLLLMTVAAAPDSSGGTYVYHGVRPSETLPVKSLPSPSQFACTLARTLPSPSYVVVAGGHGDAVIGWHLPRAFQLGMRAPVMHILEDLSFLVAGLLFWRPIVESPPKEPGPLDGPWPSTFSLPRCLAMYCPHSWCSVIDSRLLSLLSVHTAALQCAPHRGQRRADALMWVWVTFAYLIPVAITMQLLLARGPAVGRPSDASCIARSSRALAQRCRGRGVLNLATKP